MAESTAQRSRLQAQDGGSLCDKPKNSLHIQMKSRIQSATIAACRCGSPGLSLIVANRTTISARLNARCAML